MKAKYMHKLVLHIGRMVDLGGEERRCTACKLMMLIKISGLDAVSLHC